MRSRPSSPRTRTWTQPWVRRIRARSFGPARPNVVTSEQVDAVLRVMADLDPGHAFALRSDRFGASSIETCEMPVDPRCGGAALFGLDAPADSLLVGVSFVGDASPVGLAATADGTPLDGPAPPWVSSGPIGDDGRPARIEVAVTSAGDVRSQVHHRGGVEALGGTAGGVLVDALHRMLHLPCPGTPPPLTDMVVAMWLHDVLRSTSHGAAPTWADVAWAAVDPPHRPGRTEVPPSEEAIASGMHRLADDASWDDLRRAAAIGRMRAPELDPDEAAWMDATMFARWMVDSFPRPVAAVAHLEQIGAVDVARRVAAVLDRLA